MAKKKKRMIGGLLEGLREAAQHSQGRLDLNQKTLELPGPAPRWTPSKLKRLRNEIYNLSQPNFAALLNVPTSTLRSWEQGQKKPSGAAARLLQVMEIDTNMRKRLLA